MNNDGENATVLSNGRVLVNLGCGTRFHPSWHNFDLHPTLPTIRRADFLKRVPLEDSSADCIYHSHVLEHLSIKDGRRFLKQCFKALKSGGVMRVVIPDLEASARDYCDVVTRRRHGEACAAEHEWMIVELFDQVVRDTRSGHMGDMIRRAEYEPELLAFIHPRLGEVGRLLTVQTGSMGPKPVGKYERLIGAFSRLGSVGRGIAEWMMVRQGVRHRWMYDEFSLADVLHSIGFNRVLRQQFNTSLVDSWNSFHLDADEAGRPYKGVSLYMEAVR